MIISGNKIARSIRDELKHVVESSGLSYALHIFIVGHNTIIENFIMKKKEFADFLGIDFIEHRFSEDIDQQELASKIDEINLLCKRNKENCKCGLVVQLPLPRHIDRDFILNKVLPEFDIDGLNERSSFLEPVAGAVYEILHRKNINVCKKKTLIVGNGRLVGKPVAGLMRKLGALVTVVDHMTSHEKLTELCLDSDIIISGVGSPNLIKPDMIKKGCVLIDAGTSTQNKSIVGDISYECKDKAGYFVRTPGGVGPVTVAVLFNNLTQNKSSNG